MQRRKESLIESRTERRRTAEDLLQDAQAEASEAEAAVQQEQAAMQRAAATKPHRGARVELHGLVQRADLNGKRGKLSLEQRGRWLVKIDGEEKELGVKPANLQVRSHALERAEARLSKARAAAVAAQNGLRSVEETEREEERWGPSPLSEPTAGLRHFSPKRAMICRSTASWA